MATIKSKDIFGRSKHTRGVHSAEDSSAVIGFASENLNTGTTLAAQVVELATLGATDLPATVGADNTPLRAVTATLVNSGSGTGVGVYGRIPGITAPNRPAWELVASRPGRQSFLYYQMPSVIDSNGRPAGAIKNKRHEISAGTVEVQAAQYAWSVASQMFYVRTILDTDPWPALAAAGKIDCINSTAIKMRDIFVGDTSEASDFSFPAHTLRYWGPSNTPVATQTGSRKNLVHLFEYVASPGWVEQILLTIGDSYGANVISVATGSYGAGNVPYVVANCLTVPRRVSFADMLEVHPA